MEFSKKSPVIKKLNSSKKLQYDLKIMYKLNRNSLTIIYPVGYERRCIISHAYLIGIMKIVITRKIKQFSFLFIIYLKNICLYIFFSF